MRLHVSVYQQSLLSCRPSPLLSPSSGAIQSFAGFTDYFAAMAQEGWYPLLCVGLRSQWENTHLQDVQDSYGQEWVCVSESKLSSVFFFPIFFLVSLVLTLLTSSSLSSDLQTACLLPGGHVLHCIVHKSVSPTLFFSS